MVVSVAETWVPPKGPTTLGIDPEMFRSPAEAEALAAHAKKRAEVLLPGWAVDFTAASGSPAGEILAAADAFSAELILVGSQGRSAIGRFLLGSISQKILTEARCSVRVGRGRIEVDDSPARIMIAFDGLDGSFAALEAAASRRWPGGSEVRVVSVAEQLAPSAIGRFIPPVNRLVEEVNVSERTWLEDRAAEAAAMLENSGIPASFDILAGNPKQLLVEEASRWNADSIFFGANRYGSRLERFLLGSTSAAVAARASSSVEVVRRACMDTGDDHS